METLSLEPVSIINKFLDDMLEVLSNREIDFGINVLPDTKPISIPPYRMTPAKLK